jgi:methylated-DNA-[protein]-cysteine S-methyltransferase
MNDFTLTVREVVRKIPRGKVMTYCEVAKAARNPQAARAVANVMAKNFDEDVPCHRVIRSDGKLGGYNRGGETVKRSLLRAEGAV